MYTCVRLSLLPSLFVKQIYFFVLLPFVRAFSLRFLSFSSLPILGNVCPSKNNYLWWVVNHCPLFLYLAVLFFYPLHLFPFKNFSKLVDNSSPGIELYLKISIAYVFYKPPQSDTTAIFIIIINIRHLAWTRQAYCD